jgi:hypothetical protein
MVTLENQFIRAAFDEKARLVHLENKSSGRNVIVRSNRMTCFFDLPHQICKS